MRLEDYERAILAIMADPPIPEPSSLPQQPSAPCASTPPAHTLAGSHPQDAPTLETPEAGKQQKATSDR